MKYETITNTNDFLTAMHAGRLLEIKCITLMFKLSVTLTDIQALATALQSGQCTQGLQINLAGSHIGDAGAQALATALQSGQCPPGLEIKLQLGSIGAIGAQALATALQSGQCPQGLQIDLAGNNIGAAGAQALAQAILSGNCPLGLRLNIDDFNIHLQAALTTLLYSGQNSPEAGASSSGSVSEDNQEWPAILNALRDVFCFNPEMILADDQLKQTIQEALEYYIRQLQNHADEVSKDEYVESYFPAFNEVANVILAMYETSQTATSPQKQWVSTLMLTLAGSLLPQNCIDWPSELSLWAKAQQLILIEKAFSLYPDNPSGLARHWQDFCDEFNAVPLEQRVFESACEVNQIKEKAENAMAIEYYYQTRANGLFVLPNLNSSPFEKSECEEAKPASAAGSAKTIFFKEAQESDEETNLEPKRQKRLSS